MLGTTRRSFLPRSPPSPDETRQISATISRHFQKPTWQKKVIHARTRRGEKYCARIIARIIRSDIWLRAEFE
jgi:hypothetical protein